VVSGDFEFRLIASDKTPIRNLSDGDVVDLSGVAANINVEAVTSSAFLSVAVSADGVGGLVERVEEAAVWTVYTDSGGFTPQVGDYTFSATGYSLDGLQGEAGVPSTITISFTDNASSQPNQVPVAQNDLAETNSDSVVLIDVLANDSDPDEDDLSIQSASVDSQYGSVSIVSGELRFDPTAETSGFAEISYVISDGEDSAQATVTVTVNYVEEISLAVDFAWETPMQRQDSSAISADDIAGYHIRYRIVGDSEFSSVWVSGGSSTSVQVTGLSAQNYEFFIATEDADGVMGDYSDPIFVDLSDE